MMVTDSVDEFSGVMRRAAAGSPVGGSVIASNPGSSRRSGINARHPGYEVTCYLRSVSTTYLGGRSDSRGQPSATVINGWPMFW